MDFAVCVMMSTYNGERYIREQIESILSQEKVDVTLFIRDDGSKDGTRKILKEYSNTYPNIILLSGENIGVANSFMSILYTAPDDFDYYAFSDQDDIWDKDKLIKAVMELNRNNKRLYASNQECVDENGNSLGLRYRYEKKIHTQPLAVLQDNMLAGCTFVFDRSLKRKLSEKKHRPSEKLLKQRIHDVWVINVAALTDDVFYDKEPHMKYRQHADNVIGAYTWGRLYDLKLKLKKIKSKENRNGRSKLGKELYTCFPQDAGNNEILRACANMNKISCKKILLKHMQELREYSGETKAGLLAKIVFNLF